MKRSFNSKKKILIIILCVITFLMAIGYSAFSTLLNINGTAEITTSWDVEITNVQFVSKVGEANYQTPTYTYDTANLVSSFKFPGDSVKYKITVSNLGSVNAVIDSAKLELDDQNVLIHKIEDLEAREVLNAGADKEFYVTITFNEDTKSQPDISNVSATLKLNYLQAGNSTSFSDATSEVSDSITINSLALTPSETSIKAKITSSTPAYRYYYSVDGNVWHESSSDEYTINGLKPNKSYTVYVKAEDSSGEVVTKNRDISTTDVTAPKIKIDMGNHVLNEKDTIAHEEYEYYSSLAFNVNVTDNDEVNDVKYCIGASNCTPATSLTLTNNSATVQMTNSSSEQFLCIKATDKVTPTANEAVKCTKGYKVDGAVPTITNMTHTVQYDSVTINVTGSDSHSGIYKYMYSKDGGTTFNISDNSNYTFANLEDGTYTFVSKIIDNAGNESVQATENNVIVNDSYNLTYNCSENGGSSNQSSNVKGGSSVDLSKTCTKTGYSFLGWNTDKDATTILNSYTMPHDTEILYAIYRKENTVNFNANGANLSSSSSQSCYAYNKETSCTVDAPTVTRSGYSVVGFSTSNSATSNNSNYNTSTGKLTISSNETWYAVTKNNTAYTANFNANGASLSSSSSQSCYTYNTDVSCTVTAPTITRSGFTITGYNTTDSATSNNSSYNTSNSKLTLTSSNTGNTWYAITSKNITITFDKNGNTSQTDSNGNASTASTVTRTCTIQNSASDCSVTSPTMVAASGFTIKGYSTGANTHSEYWTHNSPKTVSSNATWYAQSEKEAIQRTVTFDKNGNTSFTYSGTKYTDNSKSFNLCSIAAVYNGANQDTSCSATVTMPTIEAHSNTTTIIGWSTASGTHSATYTSGQTNVTLTASSNLVYYAQTSSGAATNLTASWNANGSNLSSTTSLSCSLDTTYNGTAKATSCQVTAPTITRNGYTILGYNTSASSTSNNSSYDTSNSKLTLTSSNTGSTWYAITKNSSPYTANFNSNGASLSSSAAQSCYIYNTDANCQVTAPTITRSGYTILGYNTSASSTSNNSNYNTSTGKLTLTSSGTWYAVTKNNTAYTASWDANGATLSSTTAQSCYTYNSSASCQVTAPTITRSGFTIDGYNTSSSSTSNNSNYNTSTGKLTISSSGTWYAITSKNVAVTFLAGANTASVGAASGSCVIRNTATSCSVTTPSITSNSGYEPAGWSTTNGADTGITAGENITGLTANATYYGNSKSSGYNGYIYRDKNIDHDRYWANNITHITVTDNPVTDWNDLYDNEQFLMYKIENDIVTESWVCAVYPQFYNPVCVKGGTENGENPSNFYGNDNTSGNRKILYDVQNGIYSGIGPQVENVWNQVDGYKFPRVLFADKLDSIKTDFDDIMILGEDDEEFEDEEFEDEEDCIITQHVSSCFFNSIDISAHPDGTVRTLECDGYFSCDDSEENEAGNRCIVTSDGRSNCYDGYYNPAYMIRY